MRRRWMQKYRKSRRIRKWNTYTMMPKISIGECWQVHVFLVYCQRCRRYCVWNIMFSIIQISEVLKYMYLLFSYLMSEVSKVHCTECNRMNGTMSEVSKEIKYKLHVLFYVAAIHTVVAGHKMISHGWVMFEKTCWGELPQLLRSLKLTTTPT